VNLIKAFRVDDRLIHGQVQTKWLAEFQANRVIIIDNNVKNDPLALQILKLAKPPNIDLVICDEEKALSLLEKDAAQQNARTFLIFKTITTAWHMMQKGLAIPRLIIGPCSSKPGAEMMSKNTYFTNEEIDAASQLDTLGTEIIFQLLPDDSKVTWKSLKINRR
jgi:mannose/fructose/N-acetylgalactosamine-specific phosphotransferase system component IIB